MFARKQLLGGTWEAYSTNHLFFSDAGQRFFGCLSTTRGASKCCHRLCRSMLPVMQLSSYSVDMSSSAGEKECSRTHVVKSCRRFRGQDVSDDIKLPPPPLA